MHECKSLAYSDPRAKVSFVCRDLFDQSASMESHRPERTTPDTSKLSNASYSLNPPGKM